MKVFKIISWEERDDQGCPLFWSNEHGWCQAPDYFTLFEVWTMDLPQGGAWVAVELAALKGGPR